MRSYILDGSRFYCLLMVLILLWLLLVMRLLLMLVVALIVFVIIRLLILLSFWFIKRIVFISVISVGMWIEGHFLHRSLFLAIVILFIILGFSVHVILIMPILLFVHLFHVSFN